MKEIGGYGGESPSPGPMAGAGAGAGAGEAVAASTLLRSHPAYSINNILGMHQAQAADANENILKRKREDDGEDGRQLEQPRNTGVNKQCCR